MKEGFFIFYTIFMNLCKENGKKHYSVLSALNIGSGNLARWKKGATPNVYVMYDIAKYFGCRIEDLIGKEYL